MIPNPRPTVDYISHCTYIILHLYHLPVFLTLKKQDISGNMDCCAVHMLPLPSRRLPLAFRRKNLTAALR